MRDAHTFRSIKKEKKWVRWSDKVTTPSAKCHVKEENVHSQCRKAANDGPSGKYHRTPTPTLTAPFFCLVRYLRSALSRQPAVGEFWQEACACRPAPSTLLSDLTRLLFEYQGIEIQLLQAWDRKTYCKKKRSPWSEIQRHSGGYCHVTLIISFV